MFKHIILLILVLFLFTLLIIIKEPFYQEPIPEGEGPDSDLTDDQIKAISEKAKSDAKAAGYSDKTSDAKAAAAVAEALAASEKADYELAADAVSESSRRGKEATELIRKLGSELIAQNMNVSKKDLELAATHTAQSVKFSAKALDHLEKIGKQVATQIV